MPCLPPSCILSCPPWCCPAIFSLASTMGQDYKNVFRACLGAQLTICAQKWCSSYCLARWVWDLFWVEFVFFFIVLAPYLCLELLNLASFWCCLAVLPFFSPDVFILDVVLVGLAFCPSQHSRLSQWCAIFVYLLFFTARHPSPHDSGLTMVYLWSW